MLMILGSWPNPVIKLSPFLVKLVSSLDSQYQVSRSVKLLGLRQATVHIPTVYHCRSVPRQASHLAGTKSIFHFTAIIYTLFKLSPSKVIP